MMHRNVYTIAGVLAVAAMLGVGSGLVNKKSAQAATVMAPRFEVDPYWPKPLPNNWVIGQTIGLSVDSHDNVWIIHRPGTLELKETYLVRNESICCTPAPDVLAFNPAGTLIHSWGPAEGHDWPTSNHGITVDAKGNVWLGGNGGTAPSPFAPGSAESYKAAPAAPQSALDAGVVTGVKPYHDSFILKFTEDGKFVGEIGHPYGSKGSNDTENVRGVATIRVDEQAREIYAADGYGNHRVSVWDADTLKYKRHWGAYGKTPDDVNYGPYNPSAPHATQFRNPVHCAELSNDGLVYVCDRVNDRIQVFKKDGTYVSETYLMPNTRGDGSVWEIALSRDPEQKFMYVSDGTNQQIHVYDRKSMKVLYSFGGGGRYPGQWYALHSIVTDSKGNIYTTETYRGQRVQKFVYKGLAPVTAENQGPAWGAH